MGENQGGAAADVRKKITRGLGRRIAIVSHVGLDVPMEVAKPLFLTRIMGKIAVSPSGCWEWQGWLNDMGYAEASFGGRRWMVHRLMYTLHKEPIPPRMQACHRCDNPKCVNPDHIFIGSRKDNMSDCREKGRHFLAAMTHCKRGHEFTAENTRINPEGRRVCRTCERERQGAPPLKEEDLGLPYERSPQKGLDCDQSRR